MLIVYTLNWVKGVYNSAERKVSAVDTNTQFSVCVYLDKREVTVSDMSNIIVSNLTIDRIINDVVERVTLNDKSKNKNE